MEYNFLVEYKKDKENQVVDALSRQEVENEFTDECIQAIWKKYQEGKLPLP